MDHVAPARLMDEVEAAARKKAGLATRAMLLKGFLSGPVIVVGLVKLHGQVGFDFGLKL